MFSRVATSAVAGVVRGSQLTPGIQNVAARLYHEKVTIINMFIKMINKILKDYVNLFYIFLISANNTQVIDHYENPRNVGKLDAKKKNVGTGLVGAPACGDVMKLQIEVDDNGKIIDAKFKTFGCGSAIASSSLATEWIKGKSV